MQTPTTATVARAPLIPLMYADQHGYSQFIRFRFNFFRFRLCKSQRTEDENILVATAQSGHHICHAVWTVSRLQYSMNVQRPCLWDSV